MTTVDRISLENRALRMLNAGDRAVDITAATGLTRDELLKLRRDFPATTPAKPAPPKPRICAQAACDQPSTVSAGGWDFCANHATDHASTVAAVEPQPNAAAPAPSPIGQLLEQASGHSQASIRNLVGRIETLLDRLRTDLAEHAEAERARKEEQRQQALVRAEVTRLQEQLAAAKAKLGRRKAKAAPAQTEATAPLRSGTCLGCSTSIVRAPGQMGALPRRCPSCKAAKQ